MIKTLTNNPWRFFTSVLQLFTQVNQQNRDIFCSIHAFNREEEQW